MRIDRFFVKDQLKEGGVISIKDDAVIHQWRKVLRYKPGTIVELCDNSGFVYKGELKNYNNGAEVEILEKKKGNVLDKKLTLYMSLIKKDKFELVCEKVTELGISKIIPVTTDFSIKHNVRFDRLEKIVREASEQSERAMLPEIGEVLTLDKAIDSSPENSVVLVARKEGDGPLNSDAVFVGPEGGWSEKELDMFKEKGIKGVNLGTQVLRAETAGIVGVGGILLTKLSF